MSNFGATIGQWAQDLGHSAMAGKMAEALGPGVLQGVVDQLNAHGLGSKVNSWLGNGENQPLTPDELKQALGNQKLQEIATKLGVPVDSINDVLAKSLPGAVDHASPNGSIAQAPGTPATPTN